MATAQLTAVVSTKGATTANNELKKLSTTSKKVETNVIKAESRFKSFGKNSSAAIAAVDGPLGGISSRVSALTTVLTSGTAAMTLFAGAVVGAGVVLVQGIANLDEYEVNLKRVNATIAATGAGVGFTGEALRDEAEAIALATLTSVDAVQKAQAKLLTFNRVLGDEFSRSIELSQDLAEAGFGSVESNAILLGKALQDPIKGMSALSRVGVTLSETQQQLAKDAVATGDVFAAQGIILDAISGQVDGVAEAVASGTLAGAVDTLGQNWDELTRNVAESSGGLEVWTQVVRGAAITAKQLADVAAGPGIEELLANTQSAYDTLATSQQELLGITDRTSLSFRNQSAVVKKNVATYKEALELSVEAQDKQAEVAAKNEAAAKKELAAREKITAQVKAEGESAEAKAKAKAQAQIDRSKAAAQKELETILSLNESELQAIDSLEASRITKAAASYAQQLISFQDFQAAKTEIELAASNERVALLDAAEASRLQKEQESIATTKANITSVTDSLIDAAIAGESMGDVIAAAVLTISKQIISSGVEMLVNDLLVDKVAATAYKAAKTAEVTATVAQAGLNAFAATAAIPVVGPAAAPAAAAAATGIATGLGSTVIAAAAAREQGGKLSAGQSSTVAERGQLEILTPASSSRIRTKQQMKELMGDGSSSSQINIVNINQSNTALDIETSTDDDGRIIQLIRNTQSLDAANPNSELRKTFAATTNLQARR